MKFNVDDRVVVVEGEMVGQRGIIIEIDEDYIFPYEIKFDNEEFNGMDKETLFDANAIILESDFDSAIKRAEEKVKSQLQPFPYRNDKIENNFKYHAPKEGQPEKYEMIREKAKELAYIIDTLCPDSHEKSVAMTELETAVFWANASIARN